jgi:anti-sigma factor RsiW
MKCQKARKALSAYIDDELAAEQKDSVRLHLRECESCRDELAQMVSLDGLFSKAEKFAAPPGFSTRVLANIEERPRSAWRSFFVRPLLLSAVEIGFALIILAIGLISGNMLTSQRPPTETSAIVRQSFALDTFEAAPSGSMGGIYLAMMEARNAE